MSAARTRLVLCAVLVTSGLALAQELPPVQEEVVLARGTQLHVTRERGLGVVAVEAATAQRPARARVSVSAGPLSYLAVLEVGDVVFLGGASLTVVGLDPPRAVRLARRAEGVEADPQATASPTDGRLQLRAPGIHVLPDGRAIGVGNVRADGPDGQPVVTLTVFPPGFREEPSRGYDIHMDTPAGATLEGAAARLRVEAVVLGTRRPTASDVPSSVALELLPPR